MSMIYCNTSNLQRGHVPWRSVSQGMMHSEWNSWLHGRHKVELSEPSPVASVTSSSKQTAQLCSSLSSRCEWAMTSALTTLSLGSESVSAILSAAPVSSLPSSMLLDGVSNVPNVFCVCSSISLANFPYKSPPGFNRATSSAVISRLARRIASGVKMIWPAPLTGINPSCTKTKRHPKTVMKVKKPPTEIKRVSIVYSWMRAYIQS